MANKHVKRCSVLTNDREMKIKTPVRYHFKPIKMAILKKSKANKRTKTENNRCWPECGEIGILVHCWWECKMM